ncbi:hypothetical protein ACFL60_03615 [Candidatus Omnitrophota bacterium]
MKKRDDMKIMVVRAAVFGIVLLSLVGTSFGQSSEPGYEYGLGFISRENRPRWFQPHENFGNYDLRKYPDYYQESATGRQYLSPVTYDQFGNFLLPGGDIYNMQWDQSRIGTSTATDAGYFNSVFNNLMISSDEFSNWQTKFMIGTTMRAFFTPSTLKITRFNGVRWDASSRKNNVTLLAQPGTNPLFGVHWQSILGDILKIGGTYVSRQRGTISNSHQDIDLAIKTGPRYMYLVITDDSPEDTDNGPRVFDVRVKSDGDFVEVPMRVAKIPDFLNQHRFYNDDFQKQYIFQREASTPFIPANVENSLTSSISGSWFLSVINSNTINDLLSKTSAINYFGYVNLPDPNDPDPNSRLFTADTSKGFVEATGTDVIIYEIEVPYDSRDIMFDVLVANDYCIDIIAAMYRITQETNPDWDDVPFGPEWKEWSVMYQEEHITKSPGNIKDQSNMGWVPVRYARQTGMNVYGLNMELSWRGLFVRAEINEYNELRSYPVPAKWTGGKNIKNTTRAWFINVEKDFGKWSVGGELFDYPFNYMRYWGTVDDNDDDDQYAGGSEYPGYDVDFDRTIDTTWSGQPYLLYYFDNVSWGDDFNHNGIVDERENDSLPDFPYEADSYGNHFFLKWKPRGDLTKFTFGHYDVKQGTVDGRNLTQYVKMEHLQNIGSIGEIGVFHRLERVKDDYKARNWTLYNRAYKNSWYNVSMLHTRFTFIPEWNIINDVKYSVINRLGELDFWGTVDQRRKKAPRDICGYSATHKTDYTYRIADAVIIPEINWRGRRLIKEKRIKEFKLQPMFKFTYSQFTDNLRSGYNNKGHSYNIYPIIRFDYRVAPNTLLRCGFQGFPFLPEMRRSTANDLQDSNRRRMILAFENTSLYQGFNILVMMGVRRDKTSWVDSLGRIEPGTTEYFISIRSEASR